MSQSVCSSRKVYPVGKPPDTFIIVGIRRWAQAFFPSSAVFCLLCRRVIAAKPPENAHIEQYPAQIIQYMHLLLCNSLQVQWTFPVDAAIMKTNDISRRYAPWFWRDFCAMCAFILRRTSRPTTVPQHGCVSASWAQALADELDRPLRDEGARSLTNTASLRAPACLARLRGRTPPRPDRPHGHRARRERRKRSAARRAL